MKFDKIKKNKWVESSIYFLFFIFIFFAIRYQYLLLNYKLWGDEAETVVAAKMMVSGMKLYSEIFNHHGPLTFFSGMIVESLGNFGIKAHRVPIALLQVLAIISIYKSPILESTDRLIKLSLLVLVITMMLVLMPEFFGHMYKYQVIVGLLLVFILSQYTLPSILVPGKVKKLSVVLGNSLITCLPFLAVTYLPISALLFLLSIRKKHIKYIIIGVLISFIFNMIFLGFFGSYSGFLAFHIYLNAKILPFYSGVQPGGQLILNAFNIVTSDFTYFFSLSIVLISAAILASGEKGFPWRVFLLLASVASLLIRGSGFHAIPYFYAFFALIIPLAYRVNKPLYQSKYVLLLLIVICLVKLTLFIPTDKRRISSQKIPVTTEFSKLAQEFTNKDDKIIAYSFNNLEYIAAERLPASGHFFYLPWQEKYNENPKFGIKIDACKQISEVKPKIMFINKWTVWDKYPWEDYAGCIQNIIDREYIRFLDRPYYIRNDMVNDTGFLHVDSYQREMRVSKSFDESNSIDVNFIDFAKESNKKLIRIGLMFSNNTNDDLENLELLLNTNNENFKVEFSLAGLLDKEYKYFDVPERYYDSGLIQFTPNEGLTVWESHLNENDVLTCMKYFYSDGSIDFTPGCSF